MKRKALLAVAVVMVAGCNAQLPDPDSPGARLYRERCNSCHRVYAPGLLKPEMWKYQVDRMQGELVRRGAKPLSEAERATILDYLQTHAGK